MEVIRCLALILSFLLSLTQGSPTVKRQGGCASPVQRRSWTALSNDQKQAYINAEKCLQAAPAQYGVPGARTIWDELQYSHIRQSNFIHGVGAFLPWHRYYMKAHEVLLSKHCGYNSGVPYWIESEHANNIRLSPIWDAATGMGGDGNPSSPDRCLADGPFAGLTLIYNAQGEAGAPYCLAREIDVGDFQSAGQGFIDECFGIATYWDAMQCYANAVHWSGHAGTGRTMEDAMLAPGDPIFFLHHTNLDRLYHLWQQANPARLNEIGGRNTPGPEFNANNGWTHPGPEFTAFSGDPGEETTLNHVLWMANLLPNVTIQNVLDIHGETICADYV